LKWMITACLFSWMKAKVLAINYIKVYRYQKNIEKMLLNNIENEI